MARGRGRILIGKPGLDGHDRGARYVARLLRDAGYEVIYTGVRRSPEEIVDAAIEGHVDAIGLSVLSGAHRFLFQRVIDLLAQRGAGRILVFGGGTIPDDDIPHLKEIGVRAIFTPGASAKSILSTIDGLLGRHSIDRAMEGRAACGSDRNGRPFREEVKDQ
jgi:methylmalonyl-CoA mutase, C-terminal domain